MSQLVVQNDQVPPEQLLFGIQPPSSSSTDSTPQFMDSTFQDSPTIGRTQLLAYTSSNTPSQAQTPLSSGSRYEMANSRFSLRADPPVQRSLRPVVSFFPRRGFSLCRRRRGLACFAGRVCSFSTW